MNSAGLLKRPQAQGYDDDSQALSYTGDWTAQANPVTAPLDKKFHPKR